MKHAEIRTATPGTSVLVSYRAGTLSPWKAYAEIIDNSFDADATRVVIQSITKDDVVIVEDDGVGCSDPDCMVKLGGTWRQVSGKSTLGRYGIGLKEGSVWLCRWMKICSAFAKGSWTAKVDWDRMIKSDRWEYDVQKDEPRDSTGVRIEFHGVYAGNRPDTAATSRQIAHVFRPALLDGRQIIINGSPLAVPPLLARKDVRTIKGEFEGKSYIAEAGIKDEEKGGYGWTIAYGHRVLVSNYVASGFGDHSPARFYGYVTLEDGETPESKWSLNRFKDGFGQIDDFLHSLLPKIEDLLVKAQSEGIDMQVSEVFGDVSLDISSALQDMVKEKRPGNHETKGTAKGKKSGKKRIRAAVSDPEEEGSVIKRVSGCQSAKIYLDGQRDGLLGSVDKQGGTIAVHLNPDHPEVVVCKTDKSATKKLACSLIAAYLATGLDPQIQFVGFANGDAWHTFVRVYSKLMNGGVKPNES